jgi:hypothetical protein
VSHNLRRGHIEPKMGIREMVLSSPEHVPEQPPLAAEGQGPAVGGMWRTDGGTRMSSLSEREYAALLADAGAASVVACAVAVAVVDPVICLFLVLFALSAAPSLFSFSLHLGLRTALRFCSDRATLGRGANAHFPPTAALIAWVGGRNR